jgi:hypothetical protein
MFSLETIPNSLKCFARQFFVQRFFQVGCRKLAHRRPASPLTAYEKEHFHRAQGPVPESDKKNQKVSFNENSRQIVIDLFAQFQ